MNARLTRRFLLRKHLAAGCALLGPARGMAAGYRPVFAMEAYVWTQVFARQKRTLDEGMDEMFRSSRGAGFRLIGLGTDCALPELREKTVRLLKKYEMAAVTLYAAGPMYERSLAEATLAECLKVAEAAPAMGTVWIMTNPRPKPQRAAKSDAELAVQADYVNRFGEALRQRGLRLVLHHHNPEMAGNAREFRHLLGHTDPALASICVDYDWAVRGGQDPMAIVRAAGSRLSMVHLRNASRGVWTESLGEGDYDYSVLAGYLKQIGFQGHLVVELAYEEGTRITRPLTEDLRLSRVFAEKTFR